MRARSIASFVKFVLDATWWLIAVALGLVGLLLVSSFFVELQGPHLTLSLPVALQLDAPIHGVNAATDAQLEQLHGSLRFPAHRGVFFSGSIAVVELMFGYLLWLVTQLRHVFRALRQGLPFVPENARRIRWVGMAMIAGELGRAVIVYFWSYYTSQHFTANGLRFFAVADISPMTIVGGLAVVVIAEVFHEGSLLREDQSLTI